MSALIATAVAVLLIWWLTRALRRQSTLSRYQKNEMRFMPKELAQGTLVLSETYLRTRIPRPLGARFDQVFRTPDGLLVPVDTKRHRIRRVTDYDRIEVSVQGAVLRHSGDKRLRGNRVAQYGYIRLARSGEKPEYLRFPLLEDHELGALHDRYRDLHSGRTQPRSAPYAGMCKKCAYIKRCPPGRQRIHGS